MVLSAWVQRMQAVAFAVTVLLAMSPASEAQRLLDEKPFDQIVLNAANDNAVLRVRTLQFPYRKVPDPFPGGRLEVRLVDNLAQPYEVAWRDIARIDLFEQLLLQEAAKLSDAGKFDEAFDYFLRLYDRYPETPGLQTAASRYLQQNALAAFKEGNYDRALAMLASLYESQPSFPGLGRAVDTVADQIIQGHLASRDYRSARSVLDVVDRQFRGLTLTVVDRWKERFEKGADDQVRAGVRFYRDKKYREARSAALQAQAIWPEHQPARRLLALIQRDNPAVIVGVRTAAPTPLQPRLDSLASQRAGFLAAPTLTRIVDYSPEGGIYASPIGAVGLDATGRELTLSVLDYLPESPAALAAPSAVSRWMLKAADPTRDEHRPELSSVVGTVLIPEPDLLVFGLARSHVRPEALLQEVTLEDCNLPPPFGSYEAVNVDDVTVELQALDEGVNVSVVEERLYRSDGEALAALARGDVDVLARLAPWQAPSVRANRELALGQYRLPTVHVLIPTKRQPILDRREFRRALCYGIDRERILKELIQGGEQLPGYQVVSGPFPAGISLSDPVRYAYNDGVQPRPYEPRLAALLAALTWTNLQKAEKAGDDSGDEATESNGEDEAAEPEIEIDPFPELRLAHSPDPVARAACEAIRQQLAPLSIPIELVELPEEKLLDPDGDFDLRYAELALWEPVIDAKQLLGERGIAGRCSDPMFSALQRLDEARNWNDALKTLRDIHELAAGDMPVIPLWQTANYFAYRRELAGLPASTIHLYQSVGDWRKEYRTAAE